MPVIATFLGILIKLFHEDHNPPHFHAEYAEYRAIVEIDTGKVLRGRLPKRVASLVEEWRAANIEGLRRSWSDAQSGRQPRRIRPLR